MSRKSLPNRRAFAETAAAYGPEDAKVPHTKLSISLPSDLVDAVRDTATQTGLSVSATIAAALRRTIEEAEQASLDRALELDAEESLAWANAYLPVAARLMSELEW